MFFTLGGGRGCKIADTFTLLKMLHASEVKFELISRHFTHGKQMGNCLLKVQATRNGKKVLYSK